jgi:drug/metabolite transporter (DMT)-like permease
MTPQIRYSLYVLLAAALSAFGWLFTEIALQFYHVTPTVAVISTSLIGGAILLLISARSARRTSSRWQPRDWLWVMAIGLIIYTIGFSLNFNAIRLIGAGKTVLLGRLDTLFVIILAIIFLGEPLSLYRWLAGIFGIAGAILINFDPQALQLNFGWGEALAILTPLSVATGVIMYKPLLDRVDAGSATGLALLFGGLFLIPVVFFSASIAALGWGALLVLLCMGVIRGLSWFLYNVALSQIGVSPSSIIFLSSGFFTIALQLVVAGWIPALGLRPPQNLLPVLLGGVLIAIGIVILQRETS